MTGAMWAVQRALRIATALTRPRSAARYIRAEIQYQREYRDAVRYWMTRLDGPLPIEICEEDEKWMA